MEFSYKKIYSSKTQPKNKFCTTKLTFYFSFDSGSRTLCTDRVQTFTTVGGLSEITKNSSRNSHIITIAIIIRKKAFHIRQTICTIWIHIIRMRWGCTHTIRDDITTTTLIFDDNFLLLN